MVTPGYGVCIHMMIIMWKQKGKTHKGTLCDKKFDRSSRLQEHVFTTHTGEKPYLCNLCGENFSVAVSLARHKATVHDQIRHTCEDCDFSATTPGYLKVYVQSKHGRYKILMHSVHPVQIHIFTKVHSEQT